METDAQYSKKICFMVWGDKIDQFSIKQEETLAFSIDLESREYIGCWYTDLKAWKVSRDGIEASNSYSSSGQDRYEVPNVNVPTLDNDDIPF